VCLSEVALAGDLLLAKTHKASREVRAQLEQLLTAWRQLLQQSNSRGRGLEEAQDILELNNQAEKVEEWIRDKVCVWLILSDVFWSVKNIRDLYKGIHFLKNGYQPRSNLVKDENGDLADSHILSDIECT
jgi:hypothetical protein